MMNIFSTSSYFSEITPEPKITLLLSLATFIMHVFIHVSFTTK